MLFPDSVFGKYLSHSSKDSEGKCREIGECLIYESGFLTCSSSEFLRTFITAQAPAPLMCAGSDQGISMFKAFKRPVTQKPVPGNQACSCNRYMASRHSVLQGFKMEKAA